MGSGRDGKREPLAIYRERDLETLYIYIYTHTYRCRCRFIIISKSFLLPMPIPIPIPLWESAPKIYRFVIPQNEIRKTCQYRYRSVFSLCQEERESGEVKSKLGGVNQMCIGMNEAAPLGQRASNHCMLQATARPTKPSIGLPTSLMESTWEGGRVHMTSQMRPGSVASPHLVRKEITGAKPTRRNPPQIKEFI